MTQEEKQLLEFPEKMCEYCCNFDKEHIGMDGTALCKLTMTLAYAENYGGNCMFYNVPQERIIVPPCWIGNKVYQTDGVRIYESTINEITFTETKIIYITENIAFDKRAIGNSIFLTKEEAEAALKECERN